MRRAVRVRREKTLRLCMHLRRVEGVSLRAGHKARRIVLQRFLRGAMPLRVRVNRHGNVRSASHTLAPYASSAYHARVGARRWSAAFAIA